ncbi:hypothetical protein GCM10010345_80350 [Streptomyces canarius]|uniref:Uncharacterized protein n=1 Tax=Streptomyces canarius TaxID=285453 RepID=A0ABQ3D811_9ACTN|nr:hypothetical protein GCM10010345_80350 [Streptomyces canarius]
MRGRLTLSSMALSVSLLAGAGAATRAQCEAAGQGFPHHVCKQSTTTTNWHLWICD